jgi:hypothetical protein
MSAFADATLMALSDDAALAELLDPPGDPTHARMRALLGAMYDLSFAEVHDVLDVTVRRNELARAAFPARENRGDITRTSPGYARTDFRFDEVDRLSPLWVDLAAELDVTLLLEVDAGEIESIVARGIEDFTTLAQFEARFAFLDLADFMTRHGLTTVDDLREAFDYLKLELRARTPAAFDPNDPANRFSLRLNVALLFRDALDMAEGLRAAKLAQAVLERTVAAPADTSQATAVRPFAAVVVFPAAELAGASFTAAQVQHLFALEGVVAIFRT